MKEEVIDKDIVAGRIGREYVKTALYAFPALKVMAEEVGEHVKRKATYRTTIAFPAKIWQYICWNNWS